MWSVDTGERALSLHGEQTLGAREARMSAGGGKVLTTGLDRTIRIWDVASGQCVRTMAGHGGRVTTLSLGTSGRLAASAEQDGSMRIWDLDSGECVRELTGQSGPVASVCLSADERFVLAGGESAIALWDVHSGQCRRRIEGHEDDVNGLAVTADSDFLLSGGNDTTARIWALDWELALR